MISGSIGCKLTKSNDSHGLNDMNKMTANQAKTHFGELLLQTQREPVQITKNGKPAGMISQETYEVVMTNAERLDSAIIYNRDFNYNLQVFFWRLVGCMLISVV